MDDEDEVTYTSNAYTNGRNENPSDGEDDDNDEDDEKGVNEVEDDDEEDDDDDDGNGVQRISKDDYEYGDDDDDDDDDGDEQRHPKKRKLKNLISSYEFAPRLPLPPSSAPPSLPKPSYGGRNPLTDWTEHETLVLLDAWGDRFLKHGRKSLRSEEWQEVAEKVSEGSKIERTDTQCRNRLDTLKKKYKEKMKVGGGSSEWVYFKKMDGLLSSQIQQSAGLSCGVDSGEYVFMNPRVYLNRSNGLDEMMDSPGGSPEGEESDGLPPKKAKRAGGGSFKMIADSFRKFSKIYERIESSKRQQMVELEKMRMDFHRDLELQKTEILERAQAAIAKIRTGEDEDNGGSGENVSG